MPQVQLVVEGRVQGVGFRAYVRSAAERFGVDGAVWNTRQGNVEVVASHSDEAVMDRFIEAVRQGPGYVSGVHVTRAEIVDLGPGFTIGQTI